ncbi:MAG: hypothetical protein JW873_06545 [Candidatus Saganbacteria bacterium]|nr:hypothetical protein [Candidatus Saganbacteria bacterium]
MVQVEALRRSAVPLRPYTAAIKSFQLMTGPAGGPARVSPFVEWNDAAREVAFDANRIPGTGAWATYLGTINRAGLTGIAFQSGGFAFGSRDAGLERLTAFDPMAQETVGGRNIYVKVLGTNEFFSPAGRPARNDDVVKRECVHGMGYEINRATYNNAATQSAFEVQQTIFTPVDDPVELHELVIKNTSRHQQTVRVTVMDEFGGFDAAGKWGNAQRTQNIELGDVVAQSGATTVYYEPNYKFGPWSNIGFATTFGQTRRIVTDLDEFVGPGGSRETPRAVKDESYQAQQHNIYGGKAISAQELEITLQPGEERTIRSLVGLVKNPKDAKFIGDPKEMVVDRSKAEALVAKYAEPEAYAKAFDDLKGAWEKQLFNLQVHTTSETVNRMVNIWLQFQALVVFAVSRSLSRFESGLGRGLGFRDSLQDILGYVHSAPELARERIIDLLSAQFPDGCAFHNFSPLSKKGNEAVGGHFYDDPGWIALALHAYLAETGDYSILEERVRFSADPLRPETTPEELAPAPVLEHLKRAMQHMYTKTGPHGLPLIGRADWNDCLNLNLLERVEDGANYPEVGFQTAKLAAKHPSETRAESLMIAGLFIVAAEQAALIYDKAGDSAEAQKLRAQRVKMIAAVEQHGWDANFGGGEWFRRAYDRNGAPLGSALDPAKGATWIESQGWNVMAGVGREKGWTAKALDSVDSELLTPWGIKLLNPPIRGFNPQIGEVTAYPPGTKEGGGIFSHNNPWVIIGNLMEGTRKNINRAYDYFQRIAPWFFSPERLLQYQCEPHCFAQVTVGPDAPEFTQGKGRNSWTTGTAAWAKVAFVEHILGLKRTLEGMVIDPSYPDDLISKEAPTTMNIGYRGIRYNINVSNPNGVNRGVSYILVDGKKIDGQLLPLFEKGTEHEVTVMMGEPQPVGDDPVLHMPV